MLLPCDNPSMVRPQLNTVIFRFALTVALLWVLGAAWLGYSEYQATPSFRYSEEFQAELANCQAERLRPADDPDWVVRRPTADELSSCTDGVESRVRLIDQSERSRVTTSAAKWTLLPPFVLLLVAAFYRPLLAGTRALLAGYLAWLLGKKEPPK